MSFENYPDFNSWSDRNEFAEPGIRAAIDIGTNTVLLLVADVNNGKVKVLHEDQRIPRLGKGVDSKRVLSVESMRKVIEVINILRERIYSEYGSIPVIITGTSAIRDAQNRQEFLLLVEEATGYRIRVLSGDEEAKYTFYGGLSQLNIINTNELITVVDIGGGSSEIVTGMTGEGIVSKVSYDFGTVRFRERYFSDVGSISDAITNVEEAVLHQIGQNPVEFGESVVGVAGTATTIGMLVHNFAEYSSEAMNDLPVTLHEINALIEKLRRLSSDEILKLNPGVLRGREDLILTGAVILQTILKYAKKEEFRVSSGGLRHGVIQYNLFG